MQEINSPIKELSWQAPEYEHREKTSDWFWAIWIISIAIAATSILLGNFLLAILILLSIFSLTMYSVRKPEIIDINVDTMGITVHKTRYPYTSLESFLIETKLGMPKILVKSKKTLVPLIVIPIDTETIRIEEVRDLINDYLPEEDLAEPFLMHIMRFLGF